MGLTVWHGKPLFVNGKLALSLDCCCGEAQPVCHCTTLFPLEFFYTRLTVPGTGLCAGVYEMEPEDMTDISGYVPGTSIAYRAVYAAKEFGTRTVYVSVYCFYDTVELTNWMSFSADIIFSDEIPNHTDFWDSFDQP